MFSCDNITVLSVSEYICNQQSRTIILIGTLLTYYASSRVEQFYSYLRNKNVLLLDGTVEVIEDDEISMPASASIAFVYILIALSILLFCVIVIVIIIVLVVKKFRKKSFKKPRKKSFK